MLRLLGTKVLLVFLRVGWKPEEFRDSLGASPLSWFLGLKDLESVFINTCFLIEPLPVFILKGLELIDIVDFPREELSGFVGVGAVAVEEATEAPRPGFL